jgi:two-component system phosphate regulon response regulator OmpR
MPAIQKAEPLASAVPDDEAPHILLVDDDRRIRELLTRYLSDNGFRVTAAGDAAAARQTAGGMEFDLMVVDIMMPGEDGISLTRSLRDKLGVPVLMLTALAETEHRIEGLEAGADDYLPKPFDPRELILRISSILKRTAKPRKPVIEQVSFGSFSFHVGRRELRNAGRPVRLTDRERQILAIFASRPGETVARHELLGEDSGGERKIDVQINRLRRKIEDDAANPKWLQTVRGIGYRLCID